MTALSVAGAVVQFVDFASKIVSKGWRLYRSPDGALLEHRVFELTTRDLISLVKRLRNSLPKESSKSLNQGDRGDQGDQALAALCERCTSAGDTVLAGLKALKIKGKNSPWKSFRQALKIVWDTEELNAVADTLVSIRREVETHILISLK
jgi:hypothetical protein